METKINLTLAEFNNELRKCSGKRIALDVETTGLHWWQDNLITVGFFCPDADICGSIDIRDKPDLQEAVRVTVIAALSPCTKVVMHNAKFDLSFLHAAPLATGWDIYDTTVMIHLYDSRLPKSLEQAEKKLLGSNSKREHIEDAPARKKVWDWDANLRQRYCINDCRVTYQFAEVLYPILGDNGLTLLFKKEMKYLKVLYEVEHYGFRTNPDFLDAAIEVFSENIERMEEELYNAVGYKFNWRSNPQISKALYEDMGIPRPVNPFADADGVDRTRFAHRGQYNKYATAGFLLVDKVKHPLGKLVVSLRETYKLRKTIQSWIELSDSENVIHTNFKLTGTRTGRLSSSEPNLQNITSTVRNVFMGEQAREEEYNLRQGFIARSGKILVAVDYKQFEMFMFGLISQDPHMLPFLQSGEDIHSAIAKKVWGIADPTHRKWSKQIALGLLYGMTLGSLMHKLDMSRAEAAKVADDYTTGFPRIKPWMAEVIATCEKKGYLRYWSGRIWRENKKEDMYRGVNAIIQGGCADVLSIAVLRVYTWLKTQGEDYHIVNIVHDEIISECPVGEEKRVATEIGKIMTCGDLLGLPFRTDAKAGYSYGTLKPIEIG